MGSLVWYLEMLHLRRDGSFSLRSQPAQVFYKWWFLQHHLLLWASVHISSYCPLEVYSSHCTKILQRILDTQLTSALWLNLHPLSNGLCSPTLLNLPWPCQYSPLCHIYRSWVKCRQTDISPEGMSVPRIHLLYIDKDYIVMLSVTKKPKL